MACGLFVENHHRRQNYNLYDYGEMSKSFTVISDDLCRVVGADGAVICGKVATMCGTENNPCTLSNDYLCELLHISLHTLLDLLSKLQMLGYIERTSGNGRGGVSTYKKGANIATFIIPKRVQKLHEKGAEIASIKYNENINNRAGAREDIFRKKNNNIKEPRKGDRLTYMEFKQLFGEIPNDPPKGWKRYKPDGYTKFIFEKL